MFKISFRHLVATTALVVSTAQSRHLPNEPRQLIRNGEDAKVGEFPYHVGMGFCGGALVAEDMVLFAAHCKYAEGYEGIQLNIGEFKNRRVGDGSQARWCSKWEAHPDYDDILTLDNDFALCKLNEPVTIDTSKVVLKLNGSDDVSIDLMDNEDLVAVGNGKLESGGEKPETLQRVVLPFIDQQDCRDIYNPLYQREAITENMVCAGGDTVGICAGDSGGALVKIVEEDGIFVHYHLGIASWGGASGYRCGDLPSVFARTSAQIEWIESTMRKLREDTDSGPTSDCDENKLKISMTTNNIATRWSWRLHDLQGDEIDYRRYVLNKYTTDVEVCLLQNEEYTWTIFRKDGTKECVDDDEGGCGSFVLTLDGNEIIDETNPDLGLTKTYTILTPMNAPTNAPTSAPRPANAEKSECPDSVLNDKGRLKKNCSKYVEGLTCSYDSDGDGILDVIYVCKENNSGRKKWEDQNSKCPESVINEDGEVMDCGTKKERLTCSYDADGDRILDTIYICKKDNEGVKKWEDQNYEPLPLDNAFKPGVPGVDSLGRCQGDCKSDEQCKGNLRCFIRDSESDSTGAQVPGCINGADKEVNYDYCVDPNLYPCMDDKKVCVDPTKDDTSTCETTTCAKLFLEYRDKCFCDFYGLKCRETCDYCRDIDEQDKKRCPVIESEKNDKLCAVNATPGYDCTPDFCADSKDVIEGQKNQVNTCSKIDTPKKVRKQCKKKIVQEKCPATCEVDGC